MSERLILTLDGSTAACGAALLRPRPGTGSGGPDEDPWEVVARRTDVDGRGQAKVLLRLVDEMLQESGREPRDLGAVVVGTGPGTFTGVRITVATGRALSLALERPVLGVSTLAALAAGAAALRAVAAGAAAAADGAPDLIVPVVDARRGQVFYGLYSAAGRRYQRSLPYGACDRDGLGAMVAASGAPKSGRVLIVAEDQGVTGDLPAGAVFIPLRVEAERLVSGQGLLEEPGEDPQGRRLAPWLLRALAAPGRAAPVAPLFGSGRPGEIGTPEAVTPIYIRSPDADIHITKMRDPWANGPAGRGHAGGA